MESYILVYVLLSLAVEVQCKCYKLERDKHQFISFDGSRSNYADSSHFQLSFKTTNDSGLLYYFEGEFINDEAPLDYEGLYIYKGILNYFIFNPTKYGGGFSRGGHVRTDFEVNNGTWMTVEFFRNKETQVPAKYSGDDPVTKNQTGFIVNGDKFVFDGTINKLDVTGKDLYVGGHDQMSVRIDKEEKLGTFDGYIDMFMDLKSGTELTPKSLAINIESDECDRGLLPYS